MAALKGGARIIPQLPSRVPQRRELRTSPQKMGRHCVLVPSFAGDWPVSPTCAFNILSL